MKFMLNEALYLVELLRASLGGAVPSLPRDGFDWDNLYELSVLHKVEAMAYIGLSKVEGVPDEVISRFETEYKKEIAFEYIRHSEGRRILSSLEKNGIDCMPLKGWVIKDMYPLPAMRYMCDIDILFKKEEADRVRSVLEKLGFESTEFGGNPDVYMKKPILNIEMHKALIQDKTDHFEKTWERAVLKKDCEHTFDMTLEDYYIYMAAHLRKHFFGSGTGIRSVCDIYVFLREKGDKLDGGYIERKLKDSGIYDFDLSVKRLCAMWFDGKEESDDIKELGKRFLYCGAFGTKDSNMLNVAASEMGSTKGKSFKAKKIRYVMGLIFPSAKTLKEEFSWLSKAPFLLPVAWLIRGVRSIFSRRSETKKILTNAMKVTKDNAEKRS